MRCQALELTFSLRADDPELASLIEHLYADCASLSRGPAAPVSGDAQGAKSGSNEASAVAFSVSGRDDFAVHVDDACVRTTSDRALAVAHLVWEVNRRVIDTCTSSLVLHAGAVERDHTGVVVSAASGSGKSTLVAALVADGFAYLADEAVALNPTTGAAQPYPKPLALSPDSCNLFRELGTDAAPARSSGHERFVTCGELGGKVGNASRPGVVLLPTYQRGSATTLRELSRADALISLAEQSFNFTALGERAFETLARMLRGCDCYRVEYGDARDAAAAISGLVA